MRILFIKSRLPYPLNEGTHIVTFNLLQSLSQWHQITLLSLIRSQEERRYTIELRRYCENVIVVDAYKPRSVLGRLYNRLRQKTLWLFAGVPEEATYYCTKSLIKKTHELVSKEHFDLVHVDYWHTARVVYGLKKVKTLLFHHDAAFHSRHLSMQKRKSFCLKLMSWMHMKLAKRYELLTCKWVKHNFTISDVDAEIFYSATKGRYDFKTLPVWIGCEARSTKTVAEDIDAIFLGDMSYDANEDAVLYFARSIWPLVRNALPSASFCVVGKEPSEKIGRLNDRNGITIKGYVDNIHEYLLRAKVVVVPLRMGGGIKIKILEAMADGRPIVTTSIGIQGIRAVCNKDILVDDKPELFAQHIINLLKSETKREVLGTNAKKVYECHYSREACEGRIKELYQNI